MEFRLWIGLHSAIQCLILVATDASFIIKYITRFTEEGFSTLISFIFIYDAIKKMIGAFSYYPINTDFKPDSITTYRCECVAPDTGNPRCALPPTFSTAALSAGGELVWSGCLARCSLSRRSKCGPSFIETASAYVTKAGLGCGTQTGFEIHNANCRVLNLIFGKNLRG